MPDAPTNRAYATGRLVSLSTTPQVYRGFNVSSVVRNSIGDYTITFAFPSVITEKISTFGMFQTGFVIVTSESLTTMRINAYTPAGALFDPAIIMFNVTE